MLFAVSAGLIGIASSMLQGRRWHWIAAALALAIVEALYLVATSRAGFYQAEGRLLLGVAMAFAFNVLAVLIGLAYPLRANPK